MVSTSKFMINLYDLSGNIKYELVDKTNFEMFGFGFETTSTNILKDCLNIHLDGTRNGQINGVCALQGYDTVSMPPNCLVGMRTEYVFNNSNAIVEVIEIRPVYGRRWVNMHDGISWQSWKQI